MDWQPIETAPKDGTHMLATGYDFDDPRQGRHAAVVSWCGDAFMDNYEPYEWLTHWMPLPAPPEAP